MPAPPVELSISTIIKSVGKLREYSHALREKKIAAFIKEIEVSSPALVSQVISNISNELEDDFNQIIVSSLERSRSEHHAGMIGRALTYCGERQRPDLFLPMVAAIEVLLPNDLRPLAEGFKIQQAMKEKGILDGGVHEETRRLRKLFARPGIKQRYFAAGLSVIAPENGPGDIRFSNELPPHFIEAFDL